MHHLFFREVPQSGSFIRPLPKPDLKQIKTPTNRMKNSHWLRYTTREPCKKKMAYIRRFWVKEPRRSETIPDEKCHIYLHRSMRRCVRGKCQNDVTIAASTDASYDRGIYIPLFGRNSSFTPKSSNFLTFFSSFIFGPYT